MNRSVLRGVVLIVIAAAVVLALLLVPVSPPAKRHPPNNDPWLLVNYDPGDPYGTYLGNGFISTRIKGDGVGSQDGKPLGCFMAGLYDNEKLIPIPTWSDLRFYDGRTRFAIDKDADYKQVLNMKTGILTTYATWRAGGKTLKGRIDVMVSRAEPKLGIVRAEMVPDFDGAIYADTVIPKPPDGLVPERLEDGESHVDRGFIDSYRTSDGRTYLGLCVRRPIGAKWALRKIGASRSCSQELALKAGREFQVVSAVGIAAGSSPGGAVRNACSALGGPGADWNAAAEAHKSAWAKLWQRDIIIDGPPKDQQAIHSCMFHLLQSVREGSRWSIPPMGLSDNAFSGHVFWDADVWMFPALILQHPDLALSIVDYRFETLAGAMANAKTSGYAGAEYAWESGYTGREDTPEGLVYRHERHINGDVALAQWQYYLATGDRRWLASRGYPVLKATADYWVSRVTFNAEKDRYEILRVVPPDENADIVDNSAYTNAIARMNLDFASRAARLIGRSPDPKWEQVAAKLYIPFDPKANRFVAYDGYSGGPDDPVRQTAKQADTELLIYPLQVGDWWSGAAGQGVHSTIGPTIWRDMSSRPKQKAAAVYRNTFQYYAPRVMKNGPAMTSSAHSVIAARLGDRRRAYSDFVASYKPFLRGPFNYFNEKRSQTWEAMCFLTGAAGPIQAVLFGLGGIRVDYSAPRDLQIVPCLPPRWKSLKITGMQWQGKTFDLEVSRGDKARIIAR